MADSTPLDYIGFLGSSWADTWFVEFRLQEKLIAIAVVDRLVSGMSAVYTFFNPAYADRGLGTLAVLWQIEESKRLGLDWLYLGFWIGACRKMNYKDNFRPLEAMIGERWLPFVNGFPKTLLHG
jgi:arginine-tRNA-protein transferase